jgi:hypothetical protein
MHAVTILLLPSWMASLIQVFLPFTAGCIVSHGGARVPPCKYVTCADVRGVPTSFSPPRPNPKTNRTTTRPPLTSPLSHSPTARSQHELCNCNCKAAAGHTSPSISNPLTSPPPAHQRSARAATNGEDARARPSPPRRPRGRAGAPPRAVLRRRGRAPGVVHLRGARARAAPAAPQAARPPPLRTPAGGVAVAGHYARAALPRRGRRRRAAVRRGAHHPVQPEPAQPGRARAQLGPRALRLRARRRRAVPRAAAGPGGGRGVGAPRGAAGHVVGVVEWARPSAMVLTSAPRSWMRQQAQATGA